MLLIHEKKIPGESSLEQRRSQWNCFDSKHETHWSLQVELGLKEEVGEIVIWSNQFL